MTNKQRKNLWEAVCKWQKILQKIKDNENEWYVATFWCRCSFCENFHTVSCDKCPLNQKKLCSDTYARESFAGRILKKADKDKWDEAERDCRKFLVEMIKIINK